MSLNTGGMAPEKRILDNRIKEYNGAYYLYDEFGNIIQRELPNNTYQCYQYDLHNHLIQADIYTKANDEWLKVTWVYLYDALGRRIEKARLNLNGQKEEITQFLWDGSHLIQEIVENGIYTYIYENHHSYIPLAQIHNYTDSDGASYQKINYFYCDQAGSPREITNDEDGLLWLGIYKGFGELREETNLAGIHQPFRLQNQYCDFETGLHYNFFRYYDAGTGRFISQDPIGLLGGANAYFAFPNAQTWADPLGLQKLRIQGLERLKSIGLEGINLAHETFNSGRKKLEARGYNMTRTKTGRCEFHDKKTDTVITYDGTPKSLVPGQRPHWEIRLKDGTRLTRSGRIVSGESPIMGGKHIGAR
ncbi:RHS repeat domain-containing protein [Neisseria dentiae]|uniref:RHS repeat domain-containing protein n=1 Tax=Neisseria dentiae TaxID=194197 RepID=UPI00359F4A0E